MSELDRIAPPSVTGEVLDTTDYIAAAYDKMGLETALGSYLDGEIEDEAVMALLAGYATVMADAAIGSAGVDVPVLQFGAEHLTKGMNEACSSRHGYLPAKSLGEALLVKTGLGKPSPQRWIHGLDDRYWAKQFPDEYGGEKLVTRQPGETDQQYLARHLQVAIHGLVFAHFTYMR
jgi:hypothetical protein